MPFLALVNEVEVEFADEAAVGSAWRRGELAPEMWIKDADAEADWTSVEEWFGALQSEGLSRATAPE